MVMAFLGLWSHAVAALLFAALALWQVRSPEGGRASCRERV
jgi:hypothetical protein